ncbi:protein-disulfide reductase DsbD domain-containing protein [Litoreibacter meonggei]|nr:protein-disulfide reductase DsbD domain-containing protein [Litoreibacter meonggei]
MTRPRFALFAAAFAASLSLLSPAEAQVLQNDASDVVKVTMLPGWRDDNGTHFAALRFALAPGWKTYWRAPGDGGLPTQLDWSGSSNLRGAGIQWPTPEVFRQNGLRSVGYRGEFVLPLALQQASEGPIVIDGHLKFGVCEEICLPVSLDLHMLLPPDQTTPVVEIAAALNNHPMSSKQAQVRRVECRVDYRGGRARVDVEIDMPPLVGQGEAMVIEAINPDLWIGEPHLSRIGDTLRATAEMANRSGAPFRLDLEHMRITVITTQSAVDIQGCH